MGMFYLLSFIELLFYSDAFANVGLMEKTLPTTDANADYKMLNFGCVFHNLRRFPWTSGPVQILETLKSN